MYFLKKAILVNCQLFWHPGLDTSYQCEEAILDIPDPADAITNSSEVQEHMVFHHILTIELPCLKPDIMAQRQAIFTEPWQISWPTEL